MCDCGCNTCGIKSTLMLNESLAPRAILSEGLKYHMDANKPLTEHLYRAGSDNYFNLWAEARSLYSRNILEITHEDDLAVLTETDLGHFGMFEGKKVPLDFPIELNEQMDLEDELANMEFGMDYDQLGSNEKEWVRDEIDNMSIRESDSNYPDFDLNKNIRYQDTSISSGMWRYTGQEQGGKGVYRNLNNGQILAFDRGDFDIFKNNLSSHFDISESYGRGEMLDLVSHRLFNKDYKQLDGEEKDKAEKEAKMHNLIKEVTRYSGFNRNPEDPDSEPFKPTKSVSKFTEDLRALFGKFKGDLKNPEFIKGVAQVMVNWKPLLRSQLDEAKKNTKKLNKPMRDSSGGKAYKVYVKDPKTKKIKTVRFGSGGLRAKINDKKARNAFAKRHKCSTKKDKTKAGYWSCRLPRYAKLLGLKSNFGGFW